MTAHVSTESSITAIAVNGGHLTLHPCAPGRCLSSIRIHQPYQITAVQIIQHIVGPTCSLLTSPLLHHFHVTATPVKYLRLETANKRQNMGPTSFNISPACVCNIPTMKLVPAPAVTRAPSTQCLC